MQNPNHRVLVTNAESKQSLAVTRSLSKAGFEVIAAGSSRISQTFFSKHCTDSYIYTNPKADETQYVHDLKSITAEASIDILLPVGTTGTMPVVLHQDQFPEVRIPVDTYENVETAHNKQKMASTAQRLDVPVPATYCPSNEDELRRIADDISYPAVVKPRKTSASRGMFYVNSRLELLERYTVDGPSDVSTDFSNPLIQEYISGEIHDVCVLFRNGELKKALTQKRLRMFPNSGGGGVINVTTDRPDLISLTRKLLEPLGWHGVAQVEFMDGPNVDEPMLIEVNPKIWGTTELSIAAGIDFPRYLCDLATDTSIQGPVSEYETGLYFIWYGSGLLRNLYHSEGIIEPLHDLISIQRRNCATNIELTDGVPHLCRFGQIGFHTVNNLLH